MLIMKKLKVLVTGANFTNKGAQSMLFVTVDEIRKRYPEADIMFQTVESMDLSNYRFERAYFPQGAWRIAAGGVDGACQSAVRFCKDTIKYIGGKRNDYLSAFKTISKLSDLDVIIDISGYAIGEKWSLQHNYDFVDRLRYAKKKNIPFYVMPQSIGSFSFEKKFGEKKGKKLKESFRKYLTYPKKIYVREQEGIDNLKKIDIVENVQFSTDLVLQNSGIDWKNIYIKSPKICVPAVKSGSNVSLVPNCQCLTNNNDAVNTYSMVIKNLEKRGKNVYIIRHSNDDSDLCRKIFELTKSENVFLINQDLSCIEYDKLISQFDFVVGSRFHGIVHSLKNGVPCLALGWATKYKDLLELFDQGKYVFDITNEVSESDITEALDDMEKNCSTNSRIIKKRLSLIQKDNCFSFLDNI